MDLHDLHGRLERIETKLDQYLQMSTRTDQDVMWLKGHLKIASAIVVSAISALGMFVFKLITETKS